jgi:hypothetical protein
MISRFFIEIIKESTKLFALTTETQRAQRKKWDIFCLSRPSGTNRKAQSVELLSRRRLEQFIENR